jgi:molybdate transport system ATP-binding protein
VLHAELFSAVGDIELEVSLRVAAGRCLALAGPSGAGKTTILRLIAGTATPRRGRIVCGEQVWLDTEHRKDTPPERRRCGYVFQDYALFPHLCAWRNVAYGLGELPRSERRAQALELLERLGLGDRADASPATLSGGERQRVALARALARRGDVLLLDEPLSALDARTRADAAHAVAEILHETEVPVILVTHDFADAALLGDEVAVVDRGRIVQQGTASSLAAAPGTTFVANFAGAVVLTGIARPAADGLTTVALDGGGEVSATATGPGAGPVAVSVYPWEIVIQPLNVAVSSSAQNRLPAQVVSVTSVGNRVRVGLRASQPLVAEITQPAARDLGLAVGSRVIASWKATATRLIES